MRRLKSYLIARQGTRLSDEFETARAGLTVDFCMFFIAVYVLMIPLFLNYVIFWFRVLNILFLAFYSVPMILLFAGVSYRRAALVLSLVLFSAATTNSIMNNGAMTISMTVWYTVLILFTSFVLKPAIAVAFTVAVFVAFMAISQLGAGGFLTVNPHYDAVLDMRRTIWSVLPAFPLVARLVWLHGHTVRDAARQLRRTLQAKNAIMGVVAHDLRNSVGGIHTIMDLVENAERRGDSARLQKYFSLIRHSSLNSLELISDLVHAADIDQSNQPLMCETVDFQEFLAAAVEMSLSAAQYKDIEFEYKRTDQSIPVFINKMKFSRVISNLLSNAIKFTHRGGHVSVSTRVDDAERRVFLDICDNGVGIPEALKGRLFERFTVASRPGTDSESSFGLGMSIVKELVERHGGTISFESSTDEQNHGTTFTVMLPLALASERQGSDDTARVSTIRSA